MDDLEFRIPPLGDDPTRLSRRPLPEPIETESVSTRTGVVFAQPSGHRALELDIHVPAGVADAPVVLYVHGGAFRFGHRTGLPPVLAASSPFTALPARGIAIATVDYRLSGEALWPACVEDVVSAIEWIRARSDELGVDAGRIATFGESAGGYLAVAAGTRSDVQAIVTWYAPVDFLTMAEQGAINTDAADSPESQLMGAPIQTISDAVTAASLLTGVHRKSPPTLIQHGTHDRSVPVAQARMLAAAYDVHRGTYELDIIEGDDHLFPQSEPSELFGRLTGFLDRHLA